ncbi:hypothetical protein NPIL_22121 [Nephila pilipes]|uniref:Uncharacterized protein n=1 Tax=Nephila pilipes TaxID=299642 RepID=A0A8X6TJ10_NEPPI|nr:hypothetical protein NPIL_22121 [Nephila pilipes]
MDTYPDLYENKEMAQKRLRKTVRSLKSANRLMEYQEVFNQWKRKGIIEQINQSNDISEGIFLTKDINVSPKLFIPIVKRTSPKYISQNPESKEYSSVPSALRMALVKLLDSTEIL